MPPLWLPVVVTVGVGFVTELEVLVVVVVVVVEVVVVVVTSGTFEPLTPTIELSTDWPLPYFKYRPAKAPAKPAL